jgi:hypothetical protein
VTFLFIYFFGSTWVWTQGFTLPLEPIHQLSLVCVFPCISRRWSPKMIPSQHYLLWVDNTHMVWGRTLISHWLHCQEQTCCIEEKPSINVFLRTWPHHILFVSLSVLSPQPLKEMPCALQLTFFTSNPLLSKLDAVSGVLT